MTADGGGIVRRHGPTAERLTAERCHISEWSNDQGDPAVSIARARVEPGVTRWHRLTGTVERYVIIAGEGIVEVGALPPTPVGPGDVVTIPADDRQRITNLGVDDLIFLAVCTPRYRDEHYVDAEDDA